MTSYRHTWSDKDGTRHSMVTEGNDGAEAKRELYRQLGVKRLVGVRTAEVGSKYDVDAEGNPLSGGLWGDEAEWHAPQGA